jgi:hypothetical protein
VQQPVFSQHNTIFKGPGYETENTLEERLHSIPIFQTALKEEPKLTALQVGYDTGDYFIVRQLNNDYMREQFSAPPMAAIVVDNITTEADNKRYLQRLWYSNSLIELGRSTPAATDYDPRIRPWYKAALTTDREIGTAPYLFHFIKQMGLTIAYKSPTTGAVVAGDLTLYHLSQTVANTRRHHALSWFCWKKKTIIG